MYYPLLIFHILGYEWIRRFGKHGVTKLLPFLLHCRRFRSINSSKVIYWSNQMLSVLYLLCVYIYICIYLYIISKPLKHAFIHFIYIKRYFVAEEDIWNTEASFWVMSSTFLSAWGVSGANAMSGSLRNGTECKASNISKACVLYAILVTTGRTWYNGS